MKAGKFIYATVLALACFGAAAPYALSGQIDYNPRKYKGHGIARYEGFFPDYCYYLHGLTTITSCDLTGVTGVNVAPDPIDYELVFKYNARADDSFEEYPWVDTQYVGEVTIFDKRRKKVIYRGMLGVQSNGADTDFLPRSAQKCGLLLGDCAGTDYGSYPYEINRDDYLEFRRDIGSEGPPYFPPLSSFLISESVYFINVETRESISLFMASRPELVSGNFAVVPLPNSGIFLLTPLIAVILGGARRRSARTIPNQGRAIA